MNPSNHREPSQTEPKSNLLKRNQSLRVSLTQKNRFLLFGHRENAGKMCLLASPASGSDPPAPAPSSAYPTGRLGLSLAHSFFLSLSLSLVSLPLSLGGRRKKKGEERKRRKKSGGERRKKKWGRKGSVRGRREKKRKKEKGVS